MAARRERGLFDPDAAPGESPFDHFIYVIASDGDIEEGVTSEASSIAGRQGLGNLIVFYDSNQISIEDDTNIALAEDTSARYAAYGWHTQVVDGGENVEAIMAADRRGQEGHRPGVVHRDPHRHRLPGPEQAEHRQDPRLRARVPTRSPRPRRCWASTRSRRSRSSEKVLAHTRATVDKGIKAKAAWQQRFDAWATANPEHKTLWDRLHSRAAPRRLGAEHCRSWEPDAKGIATRAASGAVLAALADVLPELWGGSADLAE